MKKSIFGFMTVMMLSLGTSARADEPVTFLIERSFDPMKEIAFDVEGQIRRDLGKMAAQFGLEDAVVLSGKTLQERGKAGIVVTFNRGMTTHAEGDALKKLGKISMAVSENGRLRWMPATGAILAIGAVAATQQAAQASTLESKRRRSHEVSDLSEAEDILENVDHSSHSNSH